MTRLLAGLLVLMAVAAPARAQVDPNSISIATFNPEDSVAPVSTVEGPGVKVGEGTVIHPVFGIETGFVSNVFYADQDVKPAGVLRLIAQIGTASLSTARLTPTTTVDADDPQQNTGSFEYRANVRLSYDQMLSGNDTVNETGGLGIGASMHGMVNAQGRWSFGFDDDFVRLIRAANFETDANTNRDINSLRLLMLYHPRGSALSGFLYYTNLIDVFERSEQDFANRIGHRVGIHPMWRFLPQTQAYLDLSGGSVSAFGDAMKPSSTPIVLRAGLATLLTVKLTLNVDAGYTNGLYSRGPSFSAPLVGVQLGYRYSELGRATLGYVLTYEDSINANYYRDNVIRASVQHIFAPFVVMVQPELHLRQYNGVNFAVPDIIGPDTRDDFIFATIAGIQYNFRNWIGINASYKFSTVQTNYKYMSGVFTDDPSFVRHELLFGMRVAM